MATFVRMRSVFSYDQDNGTRRVVPAGWSGTLEDDVARKAIEGGYTSEPKQNVPVAQEAPDTGGANESMSRAELDAMARYKGLDPDAYKTKADLVVAINGV